MTMTEAEAAGAPGAFVFVSAPLLPSFLPSFFPGIAEISSAAVKRRRPNWCEQRVDVTRMGNE